MLAKKKISGKECTAEIQPELAALVPGSPGAIADAASDPEIRRTSRRRGSIGRKEILGKYWELANLDPEITKGNITGQLKALDSLREELGVTTPGAGQPSRESVEVYRSAWLRTTRVSSATAHPADER